MEAGLAETFSGAATIRGVASEDVLVDAALMRLLLAVDMAAHAEGSTPEGWLYAHRQSFELFDADQPFWQNPRMGAYWELPGAVSAAGGLHRPNGSPLSIVHSVDDALADVRGTVLTPAEAARYLVMRQQFSTGGIQSFPAKAAFGLANSSAKSTVANQAPLVYVEGATLADTLAASRIAGPVGDFQFTWPTGVTPGSDGSPRGIVDTLTWQARSVLLRRNDDGIVDAYLCCDGIRYGALQPELVPHTTFEQKTKNAEWTVRAPHHQRAGWRQLLDAYAAGGPGLLSHLPTDPPAHTDLRFIGLSSFQGRLDGQADGRLPMPHISQADATTVSAAVSDVYKEVSSALGSAAAALGSKDWGDRRRTDATTAIAAAVEPIVADTLRGDLTVGDGLAALTDTGFRLAEQVADTHAAAFPVVAGRVRARIADRATKAAATTSEGAQHP